MTTGSNPFAGRRFQDENGNPIVPGKQIGVGGGGTVCDVDGQPNSVVKIWHSDTIPEDADIKIRYMVNNPVTPELGANWRITWPQHAVFENGAIAGYIMPKLDYTLPWVAIIEYYNSAAAESRGEAQARDILIDDRVRIAQNLALGFRAVHEAGYVIGDVNQSNAEANRQNDVAFMDCDSYGFTDPVSGRTFSDNMAQDGYQAPEFQGDFVRTQEQDLFALAVLIFLLLTGSHPYRVTGQHAADYPTLTERVRAWLFPPADQTITTPQAYVDAWDTLTDKQKELFHRCFDKAHQGQPRPKPEDWVEALQELPAVAAPPPSPSPTSPGPAPSPQPRPGPRPAPAPQPRPRPQGQPQPQFSQPGVELKDNPVVLLALAVFGYGALIPLTIFTYEFRPWLWLSLTLVSALFLYLPVRKLLQTPITVTRWILIFAASIVGFLFLLGLGETALLIWPWWMWLGVGVPTAFIFLVPARGAFSRANPKRRWGTIAAATLATIFILGGLGMAGLREWQDGQLQQSLGAAGAINSNGGVTSAQGNAAGAAGGSAQVPAAVPVIAPTDTPEATPTPVCGQPTNLAISTSPDRRLLYDWDEPPGGNLTVTGYHIEWRSVTDDGTFSSWELSENAWDTADTSQTASSPLSSNFDGRTYQGRVYALCGSTYSIPSDAVTLTIPMSVCGPPTDFTVEINYDRSLSYMWNPPAHTDFAITGYQMQWSRRQNDGTYSSWRRANTTLSATDTIHVTDPVSSDFDGLTYRVRLHTLCDSESSEPSNIVTYTFPSSQPPPTNTPVPMATPDLPDPAVTVWPDVAYPGDDFTVTLTGFPPYTLVQDIYIWDVGLLGDRNINTNQDGNVIITDVWIPPDFPAGDYEVTAMVGDILVWGMVSVVEIPPIPTPPPYPDPALLAQRGPPPGHLSRAPGVQQYVSGCFVGAQPRQEYWMYLADWPSETLENARNTILLEFRKSIPKEELREVIPGKCYYVGPVMYQTDESVKRCPGTVYNAGCGSDDMVSSSFRVYITEGTLREITETPQFGN